MTSLLLTPLLLLLLPPPPPDSCGFLTVESSAGARLLAFAESRVA
jgi:hypothetical protein